jgi:6-phosphogluconolactonase (cycloisomerase 2 family)
MKTISKIGLVFLVLVLVYLLGPKPTEKLEEIELPRFSQDFLQIEQVLSAKEQKVKTKPGSGPRHFTYHPSGKFAYCIEELSGTVCIYSYFNGKLTEIQHVKSYSKTQDTYGSADIHISSDGLFLYASNRWIDENTISVFSISKNGKIKLIQHQKTGGDHPRNFTIDPSGNFLLVANKNSNNVIVFKRNKTSGLLRQTDVQINIPNPSCLKMRTYTIK